MARILLVYASTTGNTRYVAELLALAFGTDAELLDLADLNQTSLETADLIIGCVSTWGRGEMQDDWDLAQTRLKTLNFASKLVAVCGLGDQKNYPEKFADGAGFLARLWRACGGTLIGQTSTAGYAFQSSGAVEQGRFVGLILDEDTQHEQSYERIQTWVVELKASLKARAKGAKR